VLDLFSGIGGFSLGLEAAGFHTVAFCENNKYCRKVLAEHWPEVPIHGDIRDFYPYGGFAHIVCGGFPCQDILLAGAGAGLAGTRSGLWREFARVIGDVRPKYAIVEYTAALSSRGLGDVLGDLASLGYDAEWHCISASAIGARHQRDRLWIVAYPNVTRSQGHGGLRERGSQLFARPSSRAIENPWLVEPTVGRVAHGISSRVDRLKALGNAVVPQVVATIGFAIRDLEERQAA
jgi:DNA (cytosine-5)-methyltransferase 1